MPPAIARVTRGLGSGGGMTQPATITMNGMASDDPIHPSMTALGTAPGPCYRSSDESDLRGETPATDPYPTPHECTFRPFGGPGMWPVPVGRSGKLYNNGRRTPSQTSCPPCTGPRCCKPHRRGRFAFFGKIFWQNLEEWGVSENGRLIHRRTNFGAANPMSERVNMALE